MRVAGRRSLAGVAAVAVIVLGSGGPSWGQGSAEDYLQKMADAGTATYQLRQLVVYLGPPQSAAVLDYRSSAAGTYVRSESGSEVTRLWRRPSGSLIADGHRAMSDPDTPDVPVRWKLVVNKYDVTVGTPARLLGVDLVTLDLRRRSDRRLVERLWVGPDNGVVHRREMYGAQGQLIGLSTVLDMAWGRADLAELPDDAVPSDRVRLTGRGRAPVRLPYAYRLVAAYRLETEVHPADHWVYSDGLHALSVFRTPGRLDAPDTYTRHEGSAVFTGPGPGTWTWTGGGHTWMVVADEPQLDPATLVESFPIRGPTVWARLGSWWAKGFRWVGDRV